MEPWKSWAAFVVLGTGAGWYYYNTQNKPKSKTGRATSISTETGNKPAKKREDIKAKDRKDGVITTREFSGSDFAEGPTAATPNVPAPRKDKTKKGKGTKAKTERLGIGSTIQTKEATDSNSEKPAGSVNEEGGVDEDMDNKEFAKMLSELKSNKPVKDPTKKRARKGETKGNGILRGRIHLSAAEPVGSTPRNPSTTSSTTGADADDDLSPVASPFMKPKSAGETYEDAGLSDMLEAQRSGPSVLRLTESTQLAHTQKPKQQVSQIKETKKQRQNRMKNEARKADRGEAEKERLVLLENQRRTAREAEGRPAKIGMGFVSKPPATSAWTGSGGLVNGGQKPETPLKTEGIVYLDTFEDSQNARADNPSTAAAAKDTFLSNWERDLPSEEEQLRIISEMNDEGWNTVSGTKKGKKKGAIGSDHIGNESSGPERQVEDTKSTRFTKDPSTSKSGNSDVWGFGNVTPSIVAKSDGVNGDDWAVDGGWDAKKQ